MGEGKTMEKVIEDSIFSTVSETLDNVLEGYSSYKKAFTNLDLRKTLIMHVLGEFSISSEDLPLSQEQQVQLKNLIRQEIAYILQQSSECIRRSTTEEMDSCFTPSHWFG